MGYMVLEHLILEVNLLRAFAALEIIENGVSGMSHNSLTPYFMNFLIAVARALVY